MVKEDRMSVFQKRMLLSDNKNKLRILSIFAHNMTVEFRGIFITETVFEKKVLYPLNEIQHLITARIMNLLNEEDEWSEEDFVSTIYNYANEDEIKDKLDYAVYQTLNVTKEIGE